MAQMTIDQAMLRMAASDPTRIVAQDLRGTLDARTLAGASWAVSRHLAKSAPGPSVAICLPTIKEYLIAFNACVLAGKTVVPVNFLLQPKDMAHIFRDSAAGVVITSQHFRDKLVPLGLPMLMVEELGAIAGDAADAGLPQPCATPAEVAVLLYTSGTTALPKGVKLTHRNLVSQVEMLGKVFDLSKFHILSALPMFHTFALTTCVVLPSLSAARASLLPTFDPVQVIESCKTFGANVLLGVPSMYRGLARAAKKLGVNGKSLGLTLTIAGGEKLPTAVAQEWQDVMGMPLLEGFGMTEHAPVISVNLPEDNQLGTIGRPMPGVQWKIVDPSTGAELPNGTEGELWICSDSVCAGYHNTPEEEQSVTKDGWLKSGDLAVMDDSGRVKITGRIKELIISAGKNIHPAEVEEPACGFPGVAEAAAVAMSDKTRGEAIGLYVVAAEGQTVDPDKLREYLRNSLPDYKVPRVIKLIDSLPHTPTGKVARRALQNIRD